MPNPSFHSPVSSSPAVFLQKHSSKAQFLFLREPAFAHSKIQGPCPLYFSSGLIFKYKVLVYCPSLLDDASVILCPARQPLGWLPRPDLPWSRLLLSSKSLLQPSHLAPSDYRGSPRVSGRTGEGQSLDDRECAERLSQVQMHKACLSCCLRVTGLPEPPWKWAPIVRAAIFLPFLRMHG